MLERFDPLGRMMSLRQMMDRLMEDAFVVPREPSAVTPGTGTAALNAYEEAAREAHRRLPRKGKW